MPTSTAQYGSVSDVEVPYGTSPVAFVTTGLAGLEGPRMSPQSSRRRRGPSYVADGFRIRSSGGHLGDVRRDDPPPVGEPDPGLALPALDRPVRVAEQGGDHGRPVVDGEHLRVRQPATGRDGRVRRPPRRDLRAAPLPVGHPEP